VSQYLTGHPSHAVRAVVVDGAAQIGVEAERLLRQEPRNAAGSGPKEAVAHQRSPMVGAAVAPATGVGEAHQARDRATTIQDLHLVPAADLAEEARQVRLELGDGGGPHLTRVVRCSCPVKSE
jgi:hypothetical protein